MSGRWFRLYASIRHDPKVQRLPLKARWALLMMWTLASENDGVIPEAHLDYELGMRPCHVKEVVNLLMGLTLLERIGDKLVPHNWHGRQYKNKEAEKRIAGNAGDSTASERMKRMRAKHDTVNDTERTVSQITETETEQIQRQNREKKVKASSDALPVKEAFEAYNLTASSFGLAQAKVLTPGRATKLRARLEEHGLEGWKEALAAIERQPFLLGRNDRAWRVSLDFLLQPASLNKVREGAYSDEGRAETVQETAARLVHESEAKNGAVLDWMQTLDGGGSIEIRANPSERLPALPAPGGLRGVSADDG
jgi:hypothetical protein